MLTLLGTLIVVTFTAWLRTRSVHAMVDALHHEMRGDLAQLRGETRPDMAQLRGEVAGLRGEIRTSLSEIRGELKLDILRIENRLDRYAETPADPAGRIEGLERHG
jgi:hypothetical protein